MGSVGSGKMTTVKNILKSLLCFVSSFAIAFVLMRLPVVFELNKVNHCLLGITAAMVIIVGFLCAKEVWD